MAQQRALTPEEVKEAEEEQREMEASQWEAGREAFLASSCPNPKCGHPMSEHSANRGGCQHWGCHCKTIPGC